MNVPIRAAGCDYESEDAPVYVDFRDGPEPRFFCRCLVCARCGKHTGNSTQGHYWGFCSVTKTVREPHFCCPGDCELRAVSV